MAKSFSVNTTEDHSFLIARAKRVATENGAIFRGDTTSGSFSGSDVKGTYHMQGRTVTVTVTDKPWHIPWFVVERQVKGFFQ
jgi:hypothetical protein